MMIYIFLGVGTPLQIRHNLDNYCIITFTISNYLIKMNLSNVKGNIFYIIVKLYIVSIYILYYIYLSKQ